MGDTLDKPDPSLIELRFAALKATQPIGDLYIAVMSAKDIGTIANFDVRRVLQEERDVERYLGIQRPLNPSRVIQLEHYVNFQDATFPTAIIIAIDSDYAEFDDDSGEIVVRNCKEGEKKPSTNIRRIARVIDGQHRIAGLFKFNGLSFEVPVSVFIGSDISDQAYVFATVNLEQTKVSRSLTYDLFALAKTRSPQRTCHNIAIALDSDPNSPFHKRIKRLGVRTPNRSGETLTQAAFVESVLPYISRDPKGDRDMLLKGSKLPKAELPESRRLIFRNMFIQERDLDITEILFNYFSAIRKKWPEGWDTREGGLILNKTSGFRALMRVLRPLYLKLGLPGSIPSVKDFSRELNVVGAKYTHFHIDNYPPGSSGEGRLREDFTNWLGLAEIERDLRRPI